MIGAGTCGAVVGCGGGVGIGWLGVARREGRKGGVMRNFDWGGGRLNGR